MARSRETEDKQQGSRDGDDEEPATSSASQRKRRLSRKEQKALKKQRKIQEVKEILPLKILADDSKEKNGKKKKKKKKKRKSSEAGSNSNSNNQEPTKEEAPKDGSAWEAQPFQEDVPYIPTPLPGDESENADKNKDKKDNQKHDKALGRWFPKARVMKSKASTTDLCTIVLFYQYKSPVVWTQEQVHNLIQYLQKVAEGRPYLGGRLRVAPEGINATLSAGDDAPNGINSRTILEHFTRDLQHFDKVFCETDFKYIPAKADRHFKDLKILPVQELVFYGLDEREAPLAAGGVHLDARDFHNMLADTSKETVVIDVRNHYEAALGRFDGQEHQKQKETPGKKKDPKQQSLTDDDKTAAGGGGGAKYIDPEMRKSTDFPSWVEKAADDLKGKRVMMYCTGGVRCERASAYIKKTMGDQLEGVYQLQGGIERYMQAFPDGGFWRGKNFVFDKRESVSAENPNGDGGVLGGKKNKKQKTNNDNDNDDNDKYKTKCCLCDKPWDRYVGKKHCETCGVPVLMCDTCMSTSCSKKMKRKLSDASNEQPKNKQKKDSDNKNETDATTPRKMARCPLCVEQDITVPLEEVEYTDNGTKTKCHSDQGKAAPSVLKWGGGHASDKKERRRNRKQLQKEELMEG